MSFGFSFILLKSSHHGHLPIPISDSKTWQEWYSKLAAGVDDNEKPGRRGKKARARRGEGMHALQRSHSAVVDAVLGGFSEGSCDRAARLKISCVSFPGGQPIDFAQRVARV